MTITKDEYILRRLSKLAHKKWELFIISRILHKLDDPDIEFVTQQYIARKDGTRAMTDMYFPQFALHLEIDEAQHLDEKHVQADKRRSEDIISVTNHKIHRIQVVRKTKKGAVKYLPLEDIKKETDKFIVDLRELKSTQIKNDEFVKWDFEGYYNPKKYIERGYIDVAQNVLFKKQVDALRCFGFTGKGWQRGAWSVGDGSGDLLWFPRLYEVDEWDNELVDDGKVIFERPKSPKAGEWTKESQQNNYDKGNRITFARVRDTFGHTLYRYVGTFKYNSKLSDDSVTQFDLVRSVEETRIPKV